MGLSYLITNLYNKNTYIPHSLFIKIAENPKMTKKSAFGHLLASCLHLLGLPLLGIPLFGLFVGYCLLFETVYAQKPVPSKPDSVLAPSLTSPKPIADSTKAIPVGFQTFRTGNIVRNALPTEQHEVEAVRILADAPHAFLYDLGGMYLPHGLGQYGFTPNTSDISLNGLSFQSLTLQSLTQNLTAQQPLFHLLPLSWLAPLRIGEGNYGQPIGISAALREVRQAEPYTEIRYDTGSNGLQSGSGLHSQLRRINWFKKPAEMQVTFGIAAKKAANEYPNADVTGYNTLIRLRYQRPSYTLEWMELNSRQRQGENGGAKAYPENDPTTIFDRNLQSVANSGARAEVVRNDMTLTFRKRLLRKMPLPFSATAFLQSQSDLDIDLTRPAATDTLKASANRFGVAAQQVFSFRQHALTANVTSWAQSEASGLHLSVRDSVNTGKIVWQNHIALHAQRWNDVRRWQPQIAISATGTQGIEAKAWVGTWGIATQTSSALVSVAKKWSQKSLFGIRASTFFRHDFSPTATNWAGIYASLSWRQAASKQVRTENMASKDVARTTENIGGKGWWMDASINLTQNLNSTMHQPLIAGKMRGGLRFQAFSNDLIANLYMQTRFYTAFSSWSYSPSTFFVESTYRAPASALLDLYGEAHIKTATLFLSFENILSGTFLYDGAAPIENRPLLDQQFRFGILWPLKG
jgi:hypothetical protein